MKVFVIPDVHLKPWMFNRASELLKMNIADKVVCLMDIADERLPRSTGGGIQGDDFKMSF